MTSTVLDAGVFLLLVSASVLALVAVDDPAEQPSEEGGVLATTATVAFDPRGSESTGDVRTDPSRGERRVHGSLRGLLAEATVAGAGIGDAAVDPDGVAFGRAVEREVAARLGPNTRVVARWNPIGESDFGGEVSVGPEPPSDRPVRTEVIAVPTPFAPANAADQSAVRAFASGFVAARFPAAELRAALRGEDAAAAHAASRYRHASAVVLGDESAVVNATPREANAAIARGLARALSNGSRDRGDRSERREVASVRIVVRRW